MNEPLLPTHVIEKFERRWASRLAREAETWRANKPAKSGHRQIVDRAGRLVSDFAPRTVYGSRRSINICWWGFRA